MLMQDQEFPCTLPLMLYISFETVAVAAVRSLTSQTIINNSVNQYNNHQHTQDYNNS